MMIVTSLLGGRPGSVSGGAGAIAVLQTSLVSTYGVEYLFAAVLLMGILQALVGIFKLARFIKFVSLPIMTGFVNGLAIIICKAQFSAFQLNGN
jgi:SulP family sulfate permease